MKGKIFAIFAVFAMVILFASPALALETGIKPTETKPLPLIQYYPAEELYFDTQMAVDTNKHKYNVGEPVEITITNTGNEAIRGLYINGAPGADLIITNEVTGEQVVNTGSPIHLCIDIVLAPGESYTYTWDQCYIDPGYTETVYSGFPPTEETTYHGPTHTDEQVPGGVYRIHWNGAGWYAETKIVIGQPGNNPPGFDHIPDNQGTANNPNL